MFAQIYQWSGRWGLFTLALFIALIACGAWIFADARNLGTNRIHTQFLVVMLVLVGFCIFAGLNASAGRIDGILIDDRNRVSLSRFQWIMWFVLIIGGYFTEAIWNLANHAGAPFIQQDLLVLLGLSSGSAVTSGLIVEAKKTAAAGTPKVMAAAAAPAKPTGAPAASVGTLDKNTSPDQASWAELYLGEEATDRSAVDISRLQQMVITILLAITYFVLQWQALVKVADKTGLAMPTFDDKGSFLWLLGLSHAAYLASKAK